MVRLRILSFFQSGFGIYQASPGPGPCLDFIQFESGSRFYQTRPSPDPDPDPELKQSSLHFNILILTNA